MSAFCGICSNSGKYRDDDGALVPCPMCTCGKCEEQIGLAGLVTRDGERVCFSCAPAKCDGCGREMTLAHLDPETDLCEECTPTQMAEVACG